MAPVCPEAPLTCTFCPCRPSCSAVDGFGLMLMSYQALTNGGVRAAPDRPDSRRRARPGVRGAHGARSAHRRHPPATAPAAAAATAAARIGFGSGTRDGGENQFSSQHIHSASHGRVYTASPFQRNLTVLVRPGRRIRRVRMSTSVHYKQAIEERVYRGPMTRLGKARGRGEMAMALHVGRPM